jgi:murein DD-endopeptidase MepM/ murein hydrolase activator NlpD
MGATGNATGVHLHYELMVDGFLVDPLSYGTKAGIG